MAITNPEDHVEGGTWGDRWSTSRENDLRLNVSLRHPPEWKSQYSDANHYDAKEAYVSISILPGPRKAYFVNHVHTTMFKGEVMTDSFEFPEDAEAQLKMLLSGILGIDRDNSRIMAKNMMEVSEEYGWALIQTGKQVQPA